MLFGAECFLRCDLQGFKGRIKQTYPEPYEVVKMANLDLQTGRMSHFPIIVGDRGVWWVAEEKWEWSQKFKVQFTYVQAICKS